MRLKPRIAFWKRKMEFISAQKKRTAIPLIWLLIYRSDAVVQLCFVHWHGRAYGRCTSGHNLNEGCTGIVVTAETTGEDHCGSCLDLAIFIPLDTEPYLVPIQDALIHPPASAATRIAHRVNGSMLLTHIPLLDTPSVIAPTLISL